MTILTNCRKQLQEMRLNHATAFNEGDGGDASNVDPETGKSLITYREIRTRMIELVEGKDHKSGITTLLQDLIRVANADVKSLVKVQEHEKKRIRYYKKAIHEMEVNAITAEFPAQPGDDDYQQFMKRR